MRSTIGYEPKVMVVGYSPRLSGGVTHVTRVLLKNFINMELHPFLYCYTPKYKAIVHYLFSVLLFVGKSFHIEKRSIIHLIIGSPGDAIRVLPYIWLSKAVGLKICAQYHKSVDNIFPKTSSAFLSALTGNALHRVDIHCFLSNRLENGFVEKFSGKFQTRIIPNALEKHWIDAQVLPLEERYRDIVFFGRWSWEKGIEDLTASMAKVKSDVNCEIYTNHASSDIIEKCEILPWVSESEVMNIIKTAKLLVLPSYSEAYPTVLLEAAACGTPFLASNIAGIPDMVEASGGGRIFDVGNVPMLTELIDEMLADEVKWQEMSRSGKAWVSTHAEETIKQQWLDVYGSLDQGDVG